MVLGASGTAVRFAGDDGVVEEAALAELAGSGRLRLAPRATGGYQGARTGLAGLPPEAAERARWWEAHINRFITKMKTTIHSRLTTEVETVIHDR